MNTIKLLSINKIKYYKQISDKYKTVIDISNYINNNNIKNDIIQFGFQQKTEIIETKTKTKTTENITDLKENDEKKMILLIMIKKRIKLN